MLRGVDYEDDGGLDDVESVMTITSRGGRIMIALPGGVSSRWIIIALGLAMPSAL